MKDKIITTAFYALTVVAMLFIVLGLWLLTLLSFNYGIVSAIVCILGDLSAFVFLLVLCLDSIPAKVWEKVGNKKH